VQIKEEPLILSLETTTRAGSICLTRGERRLAARTGEGRTSHSNDLLKNIQAVLASAGYDIKDVDAFAVALGPGSFTGLRIGLATAKSFAVTLERPLYGVPTLHAIALSAGPSAATLAMLPAGRGEVFGQLLAVDKSLDVRPLTEPVHLQPERLLSSMDKRLGLKLAGLKLAGEGANVYAELIDAYALRAGIALKREGEDFSGSGESAAVEWILAASIENLAVPVGAQARRALQKGESGEALNLRAIYVRPSDAELNLQCLEQNK
jgi:tRNA threonylcarbamoyl adenosine modification protein YeaZ